MRICLWNICLATESEFDSYQRYSSEGLNGMQKKLDNFSDEKKKEFGDKVDAVYKNSISALAVISDSMKNYKKRIIVFMAFLFLISLALIVSYLHLTGNIITYNIITDSAVINCIAVLIFLYAVIILLLFLVTILCKNIEVVCFTPVEFIEEEVFTYDTNIVKLNFCEELEDVVSQSQSSLSLISKGLDFCIATFLLVTAITPIIFFFIAYFDLLL